MVKAFWKTCVAGLILIVPAWATLLILSTLFTTLDSVVGRYLVYPVPGLGLVFLVLLLDDSSSRGEAAVVADELDMENSSANGRSSEAAARLLGFSARRAVRRKFSTASPKVGGSDVRSSPVCMPSSPRRPPRKSYHACRRLESGVPRTADLVIAALFERHDFAAISERWNIELKRNFCDLPSRT